MKGENQHTEFKETWKDEFLEWICGFANASGGTIYIGVDDNGNIVGLKNARRLLEDIPIKYSVGNDEVFLKNKGGIFRWKIWERKI